MTKFMINFIFFRYLTRNFNYWSKKGVNTPKPHPFFGNLLQFLLRPQPIILNEWYKKYGKIYG